MCLVAAKTVEDEETPAQAEARAKASMRIKMEGVWSVLGLFGFKYGR